MKKTIIVAAALAAFAATAAPGVGARESFATNVLVQGYENLESGYLAHGVIEADKSKCHRKRKVQMLIDPAAAARDPRQRQVQQERRLGTPGRLLRRNRHQGEGTPEGAAQRRRVSGPRPRTSRSEGRP